MTNDDMTFIDRMRAVTISREYGSGGGEIAQRLAQRLGWRLIDHEVVVRVAQELGVSEEEAEAHDEYAEGTLGRLLSSMQTVDPMLVSGLPPVIASNPERYRRALNNVIEMSVRSNHVVIVGRGSQVVLASRRDVFHLRVVAPIDQRVHYVMMREGLSEEDARTRVQLKDRDRVRYLQTQYHAHPEDVHLYDLVVNTGVLDLDSVVELVQLGIARKARQLEKSADQLGPGSGLTRYPGLPADIRPPVGNRPNEQ